MAPKNCTQSKMSVELPLSYTIVYGFYGLPLAFILSMNIVVVITIYKLEPAETGQVSLPTEQVCYF